MSGSRDAAPAVFSGFGLMKLGIAASGHSRVGDAIILVGRVSGLVLALNA